MYNFAAKNSYRYNSAAFKNAVFNLCASKDRHYTNR